MITVKEATELILSRARHFGTTTVPIDQAWGRILAEPLVADRDFPPFDRVSMDGIAIDFSAFEKGRRRFIIQDMQPAGSPQLRLEAPEGCIEVMTGAMLPKGADTVIRYEDLHIRDGQAALAVEDIRQGQNAHPRGKDQRKGDPIVPPGVRISAAEIGVAATVGKANLLVYELPRVAIIATGDELVPVEAQPEPHQIRMSNVFSLQSLLRSWQLPTQAIHISDDREGVVRQLRAALDQFDVLVLSGGISAGKFDHLPDVLEKLGVEKIIYKVEQRPGKPFWFGTSGSKTVFALPGNPVSALLNATRYILPWLHACMGMPAAPLRYAVLETDFSFSKNLTFFLQVKATPQPDGSWTARPEEGKGSGDLANLVRADGFLELPAEKNYFSKGEAYPLWLYRFWE